MSNKTFSPGVATGMNGMNGEILEEKSDTPIDKIGDLKSFKTKSKKNRKVSFLSHLNSKTKSFAEKLSFILCKGKDKGNIKDILKEFRSKGISKKDPRIKELVEVLQEEIVIPKDQLTKLIEENMEMMKKIYTDDFCVKNFKSFTEKITTIYKKVKQNKGGEVASYIPQLAKMSPDYFGVSICTIDGQRFSIGECDTDFCIQSCSKIITYLIAYEQHGDLVHHYVGKEPSGVSFNAITLDSKNRPHNPCINAGAIMTCSLVNNKNVSDDDLLLEEDETKPEEYEANRFEYVCEIYKKLCNAKIGFNNSVYLSERATGHRNYALGHFMMEQDPGFPKKTNLKDVLEFYFQCCSLEITANKLAVLAGTLANGGINPLTSQRVFSEKAVKNCLSLMNSCGMYDYSGEFAFSIGIPSKSGVGGGIFSVIPGLMGIATFSPPLDKNGNSVRGVDFLRQLSNEMNFHHFSSFEKDKKAHDLGKSYATLPLQIDESKMDDDDIKSTASTMLAQHDHDEISLYKTILYSSVGDLGGLTRMFLKGYPLNRGDYDKRTPLHLAASNGHLNIVKYLAGVLPLSDMNPRDRWGNTPLDDATRENHQDIETFLKNYQQFAD